MKTIEDIIKHYSKEDKPINHVSECCHKEITSRQAVEYPLGGSTWGIPYKYDACEGCGQETSAVEECGVCGVVGCKGCDVIETELERLRIAGIVDISEVDGE